jgi:hypothetical protein
MRSFGASIKGVARRRVADHSKIRFETKTGIKVLKLNTVTGHVTQLACLTFGVQLIFLP